MLLGNPTIPQLVRMMCINGVAYFIAFIMFLMNLDSMKLMLGFLVYMAFTYWVHRSIRNRLIDLGFIKELDKEE